MAVVSNIGDDLVGLSGEISIADIKSLREDLENCVYLKKQQSILVDLSDLKTYDSVVLSLLLSLMRFAHKHHCDLSYKNIPQPLFDMARVGGVESILPKVA